MKASRQRRRQAGESDGVFWLHTGSFAIYNALIGSGTKIPEAAIALLFAFLAGGVSLTVLKEELPEERESRFWAFALGAGAYTVLLVAL